MAHGIVLGLYEESQLKQAWKIFVVLGTRCSRCSIRTGNLSLSENNHMGRYAQEYRHSGSKWYELNRFHLRVASNKKIQAPRGDQFSNFLWFLQNIILVNTSNQ